MKSKSYIKTVVVGVLQENCYVFIDNNSNNALIIDPGDDGYKIKETIDDLRCKPIMVINTHYHFDHIGANKFLKDYYKIPIAIHKNDAESLVDSHKDALEFMIDIQPSPQADIILQNGDSIIIGNSKFVVMHTPGHTKGSISLYNKSEKILFSGDTLFFESVGRWDLKGGNKEELFNSLDLLFTIPKDVIVYPGHGKQTTIGYELKNNPYKKGELSYL